MQVQLGRVDYRPHVKLTIYWWNATPIIARALLDTGVEASLIYGNPSKFAGKFVLISGLGRK